MEVIYSFLNEAKEKLRAFLNLYSESVFISGSPLIFYYTKRLSRDDVLKLLTLNIKGKKGRIRLGFLEMPYEIKTVGKKDEAIILIHVRRIDDIRNTAAVEDNKLRRVRYTARTSAYYVFYFRIDLKHALLQFAFSYKVSILSEWDFMKPLDSIEKSVKIIALSNYELSSGFINVLRNNLDDIFDAIRKHIFEAGILVS